MIKLTDKQKAALFQLNEQKGKLESDYAAVQQKISEVLEFIFDANGVDTKDVESIGIQNDHIVYSRKQEILEPEVETEANPV